MRSPAHHPPTPSRSLPPGRRRRYHLVDTDGWDADPADLVAGLVLVGATPVVALSSIAAAGSSAAAALFLAGAQAVLHNRPGVCHWISAARSVTPWWPLAAGDAAMMDSRADLMEQFVIETQQHIDEIEPILLAAEWEVPDKRAVAALFRCFHSIKGLSRMLELRGLETLSHHSESLLGEVRAERLPFTPAIQDLLFRRSTPFGPCVSAALPVPRMPRPRRR